MREEHTVVEELADGAVVIELPYGSGDWLLREILKGAGDLVVLEPEDAREAIARELEVDAGAACRQSGLNSRPDIERLVAPNPGADDAGGDQHLSGWEGAERS